MTDPIEYTSRYLAQKARSWDESIQISEEQISYYLAIWLNYYGVIFLSIFIGFITGRVPESILGLCTLILMRAVTGGIHALSITVCFIISTLLIYVGAHYTIPLFGIILMNIVSSLIIIWYNKGRDSKESRWALSILLLNSLVLSSPVAITAFAQSLTLIGIGGDSDD
ncbi:accessory protein regulator protein B [compost metagenome]